MNKLIAILAIATLTQLANAQIDDNKAGYHTLGVQHDLLDNTFLYQTVDSNEVTHTPYTNLIHALQGKVAGLNVSPLATGHASATRITLRGSQSATGDNQPLIILDGVPLYNSPTTLLDYPLGNRYRGDAAGMLNALDVENITVLGSSAAAIYGSNAANGAILINTKHGQSGQWQVEFFSSVMAENPLTPPLLQGHYGAVRGDDQLEATSWGEKGTGTAASHRLEEFFQIGTALINSVSATAGNQTVKARFNYTNTHTNGIVPTNNSNKHNLSAATSLALLNNQLKVDATLSYINQSVDNKLNTGSQANPLIGIYTFPANGSFAYYLHSYETLNADAKIPTQNWYTITDDFSANPAWILNKMKAEEQKNQFNATLTAQLQINKLWKLHAAANANVVSDQFSQIMHASTNLDWASANGRFITDELDAKQFYAHVLATTKLYPTDMIALQAAIGARSTVNLLDQYYKDSDPATLIVPNIFDIANVRRGELKTRTNIYNKQNYALFANAQTGFDQAVFADLSLSFDRFSMTDLTTHHQLYPAIGVSAHLHELLLLPDLIDQLKVNTNFSSTGSNATDYPLYLTANNKKLQRQPDRLNTFEMGLDIAILEQLLQFKLNYYSSYNHTQFIQLKDDYPYSTHNGVVRNQGLAATATLQRKFNEKINWVSTLNIALNNNKITKLDNAGNGIEIGTTSGLHFLAKKGGSVGDVYGRILQRDEYGNVEVTDEGLPKVSAGDKHLLGNVNPQWIVGWSNQVQIGKYTLFALVDGKIGGKTFGLTQSILDYFGVTTPTAQARDAGNVSLGNGHYANPKQYYQTVAGADNALGEYAYNATNFSIRELAVSYTFGQIKQVKCVKQLTVAVTGQNLLFLYKKAPHDPNMTQSLYNTTGVDNFGLPATRSYGVNVKIKF